MGLVGAGSLWPPWSFTLHKRWKWNNGCSKKNLCQTLENLKRDVFCWIWGGRNTYLGLVLKFYGYVTQIEALGKLFDITLCSYQIRHKFNSQMRSWNIWEISNGIVVAIIIIMMIFNMSIYIFFINFHFLILRII